MLAFQRQESALTLAQGLDAYFAAHPDLVRGPDLSPEAQAFFRCHDTVHVVFGCDTTLEDEAVVKLASLFGTTAGFGVLRGYRLHESQDLYRRLRPAQVLRTTLHSIVIVPRTLWRCLRQRARWPWSGHTAHADTPLTELRRTYGIRVAHDA